MIARVDSSNCVVRAGDNVWPFDIDCRSDVARIVIGTRSYTLRPLGWREKRNLARYSHRGETFLHNQFLRVSVADDAKELPTTAEHCEVLSALARWLNAPDGNFGLPLDRQLLASVTLDVCRSMQLTPAVFDALDATEVEMLWQAARAERPTATDDRAETVPSETVSSKTANDGTTITRIMVVNDDKNPNGVTPPAPTQAEPIGAELRQEQASSIIPKKTISHSQPTIDNRLPDDPKPIVPITPRPDSVEIKRHSKTTAIAANRFRFNVSSSPQAAEPHSRILDRGIDEGSASQLDMAGGRGFIAPAPIATVTALDIDMVDYTTFAGESLAARANILQRADNVRAIDSRLVNTRARRINSLENTMNDDHWLAVFAERLDEAAKAGGIDLEG